MKIVKKIQPKIVIFTAVKNRCILHGPVFVMSFIFRSFWKDWPEHTVLSFDGIQTAPRLCIISLFVI